MKYAEILKRWRSLRGFRGLRPNHGQDTVQTAISLACLRGWWRTERADKPRQETHERNPARPLTPWSHGLF